EQTVAPRPHQRAVARELDRRMRAAVQHEDRAARRDGDRCRLDEVPVARDASGRGRARRPLDQPVRQRRHVGSRAAARGLTAFRAAQRLVSIREVEPTIARRYATLPANARHFEEWRSRATSFAALAALDWRTTSLTGAGDPAQVAIVRASGTAFDVLQMPVAFGRALTRDDERPDRPPVAVVAHGLWQDRLGGDPQVLG